MLFDCFLAQMLVLLMIVLCSSRIFFLKKSRLDCFSAFAPMSLLVSIFIFYCFDFSTLNFLIFVLSLLVFFINFRSLLRLSAKLIVDSYSIVFIISSILALIVAALLFIPVILFRPVKYTTGQFNVIKTQKSLTGNLDNLQFRDSDFSGESFSGNLYIYEPDVKDDITAQVYANNPVLIFCPGIRAVTQNYEPYFMLLAQKGYKVISADLYTSETSFLGNYDDSPSKKQFLNSKFFRRFAAIHSENEPAFEEILKKEKAVSSKKYLSLSRLAFKQFGNDVSLFYIVDGMDFDSIYSVIDEFNTEPYSNAKGFFSMNRVEEYKTSGYGFIEQTDVLFAHQKGIERESKFFIPRYIATKTIQSITEQL